MKSQEQEEFLKKLSKKIISRRYELKLSQSALSEIADCNVNHLARIERCEVDPSFTMVIRIARALAISPKDLMV